jgi:Glycine-zipper domain
MSPSIVRIIALACSAAVASVSAQQLPAAYPTNGQSAEQQQIDKNACTSWAQSNASTQAVPPPQTGAAVGGGQRASGAMRGAAAGAVVGGITGDAGKGAAVGATAGVVAGGSRARQAQQQQNAASANAQNQNAAALGQAYGSCMKGKGYSVG